MSHPFLDRQHCVVHTIQPMYRIKIVPTQIIFCDFFKTHQSTISKTLAVSSWSVNFSLSPQKAMSCCYICDDMLWHSDTEDANRDVFIDRNWSNRLIRGMRLVVLIQVSTDGWSFDRRLRRPVDPLILWLPPSAAGWSFDPLNGIGI